MKVTIFDIQRASLVDGPGIRTAVFLKGCNLHCLWCHNPEGQAFAPELLHYTARCTSCGQCAACCPQNAIAPDGRTDRSKCKACGACTLLCPHDARRIAGKEMETEEILAIVGKDQAYYASCGGGVTFTGGECMLQADALFHLLSGCKALGIHTAVDTAGHVPYALFERMNPVTDLYLYDIKAVSAALHQRLTGVDNGLILSNYLALWHKQRQKLRVRVPVIPACNDVGDEMEKIAAFLKQYPPAGVDLLPCHRMGESKALALCREPLELRRPSPERMAYLNQLFGILPTNEI